jgi:CheY-like chemotaxis protein
MSSKKKILIVEDEGIVSIDIQNILRKLGYNFIELAFTGEDALNKTQDWNPDLILMDIGLKGDIDGIEAAIRVKNRGNTPIIFLTGFADDNTLARANKINPVGYIIKPINNKDLDDAVSKALS